MQFVSLGLEAVWIDVEHGVFLIVCASKETERNKMKESAFHCQVPIPYILLSSKKRDLIDAKVLLTLLFRLVIWNMGKLNIRKLAVKLPKYFREVADKPRLSMYLSSQEYCKNRCYGRARLNIAPPSSAAFLMEIDFPSAVITDR